MPPALPGIFSGFGAFLPGIGSAQKSGGGQKIVAIIRPPGTTVWVVPRSSKYTIYVWGGGSSAPNDSGNRGPGGSLCRKTVSLSVGVALTITPGYGGTNISTYNATVSTVTSSDGKINMTAGPGNYNVGPGVATGGDLNINGLSTGAAGSDGTAIGSGGSGTVGLGSTTTGFHPGGGGYSNSGAGGAGAYGEIRIVDENP